MTSRTPKHRSAGLIQEALSSQERKHYNRALKEMFEIVKLGALKSDISEMEESLHVVDRLPSTASAVTDDEYSESYTGEYNVLF